MEQILIIPDVHGRLFWKSAIAQYPQEQYPNLKIIFLGDYLDPYTSLEGISKEDAFNNFLEILNYINSDSRIIPLIGNHDWHYFVNLDGCRIDVARNRKIEKLFKENISKFRLTYTTELNGIKYLFSHAGITQKWLDDISGMSMQEYDEWNPGDPNSSNYVDPETDEDYKWIKEVSTINKSYNFELLEKCLQNYDNSFYTCPISMISRERGGWYPHGSCIWADIHEHIYNNDLNGYYQIFAHTNTYPNYQEIIPEERQWAMIDCRNAFILDDNKNINKII